MPAEIEQMVQNNNFLDYDVDIETEKTDDGIIVTKTIEQKLKPINAKSVLRSGDPVVTRTIKHRWSERRESNTDGSRTATVYLTLDFDTWKVNNIDHTRLDQYKYSVFVHDSSFRAKQFRGKVGQYGYGGVDMNGNFIIPRSQSRDLSRSYPSSGVSYGGYTGFDQYVNSQGGQLRLGGWVEATIERNNGASVTRIKVDADY